MKAQKNERTNEISFKNHINDEKINIKIEEKMEWILNKKWIKVSDLATHIVDDHTELQDLDRYDRSKFPQEFMVEVKVPTIVYCVGQSPHNGLLRRSKSPQLSIMEVKVPTMVYYVGQSPHNGLLWRSKSPQWSIT